MSISIRTEKENVDYQAVSDILHKAGLSHFDAKTEEKIFKNSYAVAFVYDDDKVVGCGRALSDGVCQAAIYNIALLEEYRGKQWGRGIVEALLQQVEGCTVILYTHPQTIAMYEKFGFRRQKTGFVMFHESEEHLNWMEEEGFLLPEGYRFHDNEFEKKPYVRKEGTK